MVIECENSKCEDKPFVFQVKDRESLKELLSIKIKGFVLFALLIWRWSLVFVDGFWS